MEAERQRDHTKSNACRKKEPPPSMSFSGSGTGYFELGIKGEMGGGCFFFNSASKQSVSGRKGTFSLVSILYVWDLFFCVAQGVVVQGPRE